MQLNELRDSRVISVGNLSVGGTGKSVVVSFLYKKLLPKTSVVLLRGYGRSDASEKNVLVTAKQFQDSMSHSRSSRVVFDASKMRENCIESNERLVARIGDEAAMFVKNLGAIVVVGKNRVASLKKLAAFCRASKKTVDYILLDDAYQNYQVKKDFEILLLDARSPFGNRHCLPAGPLREKNFSRANCIILTHADEVEESLLAQTKNKLEKKFDTQKIFTGIHAVAGVLHRGESFCVDVKGKSFLAVAGIGSFSGFLKTLKKATLAIKSQVEFPDHYEYTKDDVAVLIKKMKASGCDGIVTTQKDWQKISPLVGEFKNLFYVLAVEFQFLSKREDENFFALLKGSLK